MADGFDNEAFRNLLFSWPEKAMRFLYEHHYDRLLGIAEAYTHDRELAQDALQEVFADIAQKHKEIGRRRDESIHTYLTKAVVYHSISAFKKRLRANMRDTRYYYGLQTAAVEYNVEAKLISSEKQSFLALIIGTLPPRQKECFLLQTEKNMSIKDIAGKLGITPKAVEWNLTCARKRLRKFAPEMF